MANQNCNVVIPGGDGGIRQVISKKLTLASGTVTWSHGLRKFRVVGIVPVHASAITAESLGAIGTPNDDGWLVSNTGQLVLESSEGASTSTFWVTIEGYGG